MQQEGIMYILYEIITTSRQTITMIGIMVNRTSKNHGHLNPLLHGFRHFLSEYSDSSPL